MYFQLVTQFFRGKVQTSDVKNIIIDMIYNKIHKTEKRRNPSFLLCPEQELVGEDIIVPS